MDSIFRYKKILSELQNQLLSMQPKTLTELKECLKRIRGDLDSLKNYLGAASPGIDENQLQELMRSLKTLDELLRKDIEKVIEKQNLASSNYRRGLEESKRFKEREQNNSGFLSNLGFFKFLKK